MAQHVPQDRRQDFHRRTLIDVGLRLQRHDGTAYARQYLADVNIPEPTIQRVLSCPPDSDPEPGSGPGQR